MTMKKSLLICLFLLSGFIALGQEENDDESPAYQTLYDDPYDIRNFYLQFQPIYVDISSINMTGGFGIEWAYYHKSLYDLQIAFRTSYGKRFDITRDAAIRNATNKNDFPIHINLDFGGTFHVRDIMKESSSKALLYSKSLKGTEWASTIASHTTINGKVRRVIGTRLGGIFYSSTVNVNTVLSIQGKELFYTEKIPVLDEKLYSNLQSFIIYAGGSFTWIKNYAVEFNERWEPTGNDLIITPYLDLLLAASVKLQDVFLPREIISTDSIDLLNVGFRGGLNVRFNRKLSWGYGVETGIRPGIKNMGFYLMVRMSFPIYAIKVPKQAKSNSLRLLSKRNFFRRKK